MSALAAEIEAAVAKAIAEHMEPLIARLEKCAGTPNPTEPKLMLSIPEVGKRYGVGRRQIKKLIANGRLKAVVRTARGGRDAYYVRTADAERVLAGAKS